MTILYFSLLLALPFLFLVVEKSPLAINAIHIFCTYVLKGALWTLKKVWLILKWLMKHASISNMAKVIMFSIGIWCIIWADNALSGVRMFKEVCNGQGLFSVSQEFGEKYAYPCEDKEKFLPEANGDEYFIFGDLLKQEIKESKSWSLNTMDLVGNYNDYQRHWMQIAWKISNHDKHFMYMLKGENGLLNHDRQSMVYSNGVREDSWGFCQIFRRYHPDTVNDTRFFSVPEWQLEQCYNKWKSGTVFYAYERFKKDWKYKIKIKSHFKFS